MIPEMGAQEATQIKYDNDNDNDTNSNHDVIIRLWTQ